MNNSTTRATRVVQLTPPGRAAVASLLVTGPQALAIVGRCFHPAQGRPLPGRPLQQIVFGRWSSHLGAQASAAAGEDVVVCRVDHDRLEIHCHGGVIASGQIKQDLRALGAIDTPADPQWLFSANDPIRVEAWQALQQATTEPVALILLAQFNGALATRVRRLIDAIGQPALAEADQEIRALCETAHVGQHLVSPWRIVLAGPPNVGKSSLINRLAGYERALVYDQPGTTRDAVTVSTSLGGWPVELVDTAGIRPAAEALEAAGIERTRQQLAQADVVIAVRDASDVPTAAPPGPPPHGGPLLCVANKIDLYRDEPVAVPSQPATESAGEILVSARTGEGIDLFVARLTEILGDLPVATDGVLFTARQSACVEAAREVLQQQDRDTALRHLDDLLHQPVLTGGRTTAWFPG